MLHLKLPLLIFFIKLQKIWISLIYDFILHSILYAALILFSPLA